MYAEHARGRTLGTIELLGYAILLITRQHFPYPVVAHRSMVFIHSRDKERVRSVMLFCEHPFRLLFCQAYRVACYY